MSRLQRTPYAPTADKSERAEPSESSGPVGIGTTAQTKAKIMDLSIEDDGRDFKLHSNDYL